MTTLRAEVTEFLAAQPLKMYLGGRWTESLHGATLETRDPGTGSVIARVSAGDAADVERAVRAGAVAFAQSGWAAMTAKERGVILHRLADLIDQHQEILVEIESLDVGKPRAQAAAFDVPHAAATFRYYADLALRTQPAEPLVVSGFEARRMLVPYGVCGFIFPWNFPFLLVGWGIAPALAAGNTVVIKPAEDTPLSTLYFAKLAEQAGVPAGVINVVTGLGETAGAALARHPGLKRMSFTGSPEVGRQVAEACGRNLVPVKLELGGKGAAIVFEDVDIEAVATALVGAITLNAGQVCCTATRWLVQRKIYDPLVKLAVAALSGMRMGYGANPDTQLGPLVSEKQRARVLDYLDQGVKEGAKLLLDGGTAVVQGYEEGYYVKPALLAGGPGNVCAKEEIFGPVAYVMTFDAEQEALELVNGSAYGLANSVWSGDPERANRVAERLTAGNSWINAHNLFAHGIPYGGCNLSGCGGGVLGEDTFRDYLRAQSIARPLA
ncbi:MAG: aldehyde dehydrogenase family protein [Verrucomicrobia bacterium]|nr:aldehyde dehydrogenase family protein [Verrucomicrobiota bacterium]